MRSDLDMAAIGQLDRLPAIGEVLQNYARKAVVYAKGIAPVDTAAYQRSIRSWRGRGVRQVAYFGSNERKANWVEYGYGYLIPHHVLLRSARQVGLKVKEMRRKR